MLAARLMQRMEGRMTQLDRQASPPATILVVEDDPDTREFIVVLLHFAGYETLEAASGAGALATVARERVQAITLDLRLPDMDGFSVCRHIRTSGHPDIPIILVSADHAQDVARLADAAGVTAFLAKPFVPAALLDLLSSVLA